MTPAFNVLFLCTHNSARSIMAEAILDKLGGGRFNAYSAGSDPAPEPMPEVIDRLAASRPRRDRLRTKSWHEFTRPERAAHGFRHRPLRHAARPALPRLRRQGRHRRLAVARSRASSQAATAERALLLNELYASLRRRIEIFTSLPFASLDRMALKARLDEIGDAPSASACAGSR